jgi:hypothetical protein
MTHRLNRYTAAVLLLGASLALAAPAAGSPLADQTLDVVRGKQDGQESYGGRAYAVHYSVPDPDQTWWCIALNIHGETYGTPAAGNEFFTISFMDEEGRIYAQSEHPKTLFSATPEWKTVRITPTVLPPEFWIIVDFKPTKDEGIFIGYAGTGGASSKLADANGRLFPITDDDGKERAIDWCIALRVRNKYKGKMVEYDPDAEPLNQPEEETEGSEAQTQDSDHVVFTYTKLDDIWGVSVIRLLESTRIGLVEDYGLVLPDKVMVTAGMNTEEETSVQAVDAGTIAWNVAGRDQLLPVVRGGSYNHIFGFSRELARLALWNTFPDCRIMPAGMEEGLASYLGAEVVRHAEMRNGQKLWPIRFSYLKLEGPERLAEWVAEAPDEAPRRYAGLMQAVDEAATREKHCEVLRTLFQEPVAARDFVRRLAEGVSSLESVQAPPELFPPDLVDPPFLWLCPQPDFQSVESFRGLQAKRYRDDLLLQYDDNSSEKMEALADGSTVMFLTPPGAWTISSLRLYGYWIEPEEGTTGADARLKVSVQDGGFNPLGAYEIPLQEVRTRPGWQDLGGLEGVELTGPVLVSLSLEGSGGGSVMIGCDDGQGGGHSFRIVPGSHGEPPGGEHDWMLRLFLSSTEAKDRNALDAIVREFRKTVP